MLKEFGLDQPLPVQYLRWVGSMLQGNFGWSFRTGQPAPHRLAAAADHDRARPPRGAGAALVAIPFGAADAPLSRRVRTLVQILGVLGLSRRTSGSRSCWHPGASLFGWLPAIIYVPVDGPVNLQQMFLPVLSLGLGLSAVVMRMTRSSMLEVLGEDFIRVARAKGLATRTVLLRHALRNALIPIVTVLGFQMGFLGGVVITEQIFGARVSGGRCSTASTSGIVLRSCRGP